MDAVTPAAVAILAIYNPSLGPRDDQLDDQILYYYAAPAPDVPDASDAPRAERERAARNERLRQVGLAQGLVEFGKSVAPSPPRRRAPPRATLGARSLTRRQGLYARRVRGHRRHGARAHPDPRARAGMVDPGGTAHSHTRPPPNP